MHRPAAQSLLAAALGVYLVLALRTTRWRFEGLEHAAPLLSGQPLIAAFWHEHLALMPALWLRVRHAGQGRLRARAHVLVSQHRDGRLIGEIMRRFRAEVVHGSSSRGGAASVRSMMALLAEGELIVITPDGPRGPRRQAAPGVARLAAVSRTLVLPCAAQTTRRRVLSSWDRMILPLPFGRGAVVCCPAIEVERENWQDATSVIAAAMNRAAQRADRLCAT